MTKIKVTKGVYKPDGVTLAQFEEFEQEHLDWLSTRTCKNCKFAGTDITGSTVVCINEKVATCNSKFYPLQEFGCNQWKSK